MDFEITSILIFTYLLILILIGIISSRFIKSYKGFFLADRKISWLALTATITATTVGGSATIVAGGRIYAQGLPALWYDIGGGIGLIILGLFLASKVRKTGLITLPDITGSFFNNNVRFTSAILIIIIEIAWVSLLIQAAGLILSVTINVDYTVILFIISVGFILYTILGGQYAVIYTDFIQFFIMIIGICIIAAPLIFLEALPNINQLSVISLSFPINQNIGIITAGSIFFMMLMPHIIGPDIYSKLLSSKDEKTAKKGAILSGIFKLVFAFSIAIIALSAIILYPNLSNPYLAIPTAIMNLSPFISGIILASFLSVMISSADSCLLSAGTILSVDIFKKNDINISRIGILFVGFGAFFLAMFLGDILKTLQLAYTVFTAGLTLPILFGFYRNKTRVTSRGAFWSLIIGGAASIFWLYFSNYGDYAVLIGLLFSLIPLLIFRGENK
jgi:SSS family solute:Na+ symporter